MPLVYPGKDQPVTRSPESTKDIYNHIVHGGRAFISFKDWDDTYEIYDNIERKWVSISASAFTMSPDHVKDLRLLDNGTLEFKGFFHEQMVSPGMAGERVRYAEARTGLMDYTPAGWIVNVRMRIKPEVIDLKGSYLTVGIARGVGFPDVRFPHGPRRRPYHTGVRVRPYHRRRQ